MKTLHHYLLRQVLGALALTVMVFTFVLLLGNVLKEVLTLVVAGQATLGLLAKALGLLIPWVLVFALPMGMLTATLLVFGRFSADQELTAVRASGVSLVALCSPILLVSFGLSVLTGYITMELAPRCRVAYKQLFLQEGLRQAATFIVPGRFMYDFPGYVIYVGEKHGNDLEGILIYKLSPERRLEGRYHAEKARLVSNLASNEVVLELERVRYYDLKNWSTGSAETHNLNLFYKKPDPGRGDVSLSNMSFFQLLEKLDEVEALFQDVRPDRQASVEALRVQLKQLRSAKSDLVMPVLVQIHRQVAFAFACVGFTLVGIPLGIRAHRRETSAGVAMSLVLVMVYYGFVILGQSMQERSDLAPHLILWMPNFLFQAVGVVLLWRANRGF